MFVKEILVSIFIVTVPNLVVTQFNFSDKLIYFVLGLTVGVDLGWWGYCFLSDSKTRRIIAETARLDKENAERHRQWERECQERLAAEEKARKDTIAAEEKARKDTIAAEEAEAKAAKKKIDKAVQGIKKKFEIASDQTLVAKDKPDPRRFCKKCGLEKGRLVELQTNKRGLHCPECGKSPPPTHIYPLH